MWLAAKIEERENRFDELRLMAATLVIVSHSWPLFGRTGEPLRVLSGHLSLGEVAVMVFFVISGFLIYRSAENSNWKQFIWARALRIVPGATVCALLCVFVLGPAVTQLDHASYFSNAKTWEFMKNAVPFKVQYGLPGVFEDLPHPNAVNGSLWTLPKEIGLYAVCAVLVYIVRVRIAVPIVLATVGVMLISGQEFLIGDSSKWKWFIYFAWYFFAGAVLYIYSPWVPLNGWMALIAGLAIVAAVQSPIFPIAVGLGLPYLVIFIAFAGINSDRRHNFPDVSYGVYIYGFPIQQLVMLNFGNALAFHHMMLLSLAAAIAIGSASWYLVEKPALKYKNLTQLKAAHS